MESDAVKLEQYGEDHVRLVIARSAENNALGISELRELAHVVTTLQLSPPRVLSIIAEGKHFGVGGDIKEFAQALDKNNLENWLKEAISQFNLAIEGLRSLDSSIVVAVQGAAAGGTLGLVWAADHVIVADNLKLNLAYAQLGGSPDGGTSWFLSRLINPLRAFELFTMCPTVDAFQAVQWGLANQAVPIDTLTTAIDTVVKRWLSVPEVSLRNFKRLLRDGQTRPLSDHLATELQCFVEAGAQEEFSKRVTKFLHKASSDCG
jgi:2-(1,2-epoxy-1,2-dihydrophenyl)acetyl-CoA isomerase